MKCIGLLGLLVVGGTAWAPAGAAQEGSAVPQASAQPASPQAAEKQIRRGEKLARFGGCHDCHTPKVMTPKGPDLDHTRLLSGHPARQALSTVPEGLLGPTKWGALANNDLTAWAGPWGVSFAANLTPDVTGIGPWTVEQFIRTMRSGKHFGTGREILPPMPWANLAVMSDEELKALFAYLKSLKPIQNLVPQPIPPK